MSNQSASSRFPALASCSSNELNADELSTINRKILPDGESLPAVTLSSGVRVQTGTIATLLHNIRLYDRGDISEEEKKKLETEMELAVPTLAAVGMFELFRPEDWVAGGREKTSRGKEFVGRKAIELGLGESELEGKGNFV